GRLFKLDLTSMTACQIATPGESIFAGVAAARSVTSGTQVKIFLGGAANPDGTANPAIASTYHLFGYQADDPNGTWSAGGATVGFTKALAAGEKLWATPFIAANGVFFATANGASESVCTTSGGTFYSESLTGSGGNAVDVYASAAIANGTPVSSMTIYD